jgi:hypothetical protein
VRQDGIDFSDESAFRPLIYGYMLLPVLEADVDDAPCEPIPGTVSHSTLGRYFVIPASLRISGSRSSHPNQMKSPSTTEILSNYTSSFLIPHTSSIIPSPSSSLSRPAACGGGEERRPPS